MSLTLNQKLEMIKLSEEGMLKAENQTSCTNNQLSYQRKGKGLKENENDKKVKQSYACYGESLV